MLALLSSFLSLLLVNLSLRACSSPALQHDPLPYSPAVAAASLGWGGGQLHEAVVPRPVPQYRTQSPTVTHVGTGLGAPELSEVHWLFGPHTSPGSDYWHHLHLRPWKPRREEVECLAQSLVSDKASSCLLHPPNRLVIVLGFLSRDNTCPR